MSSSRTLRVLLVFLAVCHVSFGSIFLLSPATLSRLYGGALLDDIHLHLARGYGVLLVVLGAGALVAAFRRRASAGVVLLLILSYVALFIFDVVAIAREQMTLRTLIPEMVFFLLASALLIRLFPSLKEEREEEKPPSVEESTEDLVPGFPEEAQEPGENF